MGRAGAGRGQRGQEIHSKHHNIDAERLGSSSLLKCFGHPSRMDAVRRFYNSSLGQTCILGLSFFLIFVGFATVQTYAAKLYNKRDPNLNSNLLASLYGVFTVACFVSPSLLEFLGNKRTLFFGTLGYAGLIIFSWLYLLEYVGSFMVILGGAWCGFSAALIWTAQGRVMLDISTEENRGFLFSVFWGFFQASAVVGGILAWAYFSKQSGDGGDNSLLLVFFIIMSCGCILMLLMKPHIAVPGKPSSSTSSSSVPLTPLKPQTSIQANLDTNQDQPHLEAEALHRNHVSPSSHSNSFQARLEEVKQTFLLFKSKEMVLLGLLFWAGGFNKPYQLNNFTRLFDKAATGIEIVFFFSGEIIGAILFGRILDKYAPSHVTSLLILFVLNIIPSLMGVVVEAKAISGYYDHPLSLTDADVWLPSFTFFLWGLADAFVQNYTLWIIGALYVKSQPQGRAIAYSKMLNSAGWCLGSMMVPKNRVSYMTQCVLNGLCSLAGVALAYFVRAKAKLGDPATMPMGDDESVIALLQDDMLMDPSMDDIESPQGTHGVDPLDNEPSPF